MYTTVSDNYTSSRKSNHHFFSSPAPSLAPSSKKKTVWKQWEHFHHGVELPLSNFTVHGTPWGTRSPCIGSIRSSAMAALLTGSQVISQGPHWSSREGEHIIYAAVCFLKGLVLRIYNLNSQFFSLQLRKFHEARPWLKAQDPRPFS